MFCAGVLVLRYNYCIIMKQILTNSNNQSIPFRFNINVYSFFIVCVFYMYQKICWLQSYAFSI